MPITALVKVTHDGLVQYFVQRDLQARAKYNVGWCHCKRLLDTFDKNHVEACTYHIKRYDIGQTKVDIEVLFSHVTQMRGKTWSVIWKECYCECGVFKFTYILAPTAFDMCMCRNHFVPVYR